MKTIVLLVFLLFGACAKFLDAPHKYNLGDRVLLKTGEQAVIIYICHNKYTEGSKPPTQKYDVRVSLYTGMFSVLEYEIEKVIE